MRFHTFSKIAASLALALMVGSPLVAASPSATPTAVETSVNWYAPGRVSTLLRDLQSINKRLDSHGGTLDTFARSPHHSWQSHSHYLNMVREDVNKAGKIISELQSIRNGALPWQQQAIDRVHPVALDLAAHTSAAIAHLAENQNRLFVPEYRNHLTAIADRSDEMREMVNGFLSYGDAQQKMNTLGDKLEIADS